MVVIRGDVGYWPFHVVLLRIPLPSFSITRPSLHALTQASSATRLAAAPPTDGPTCAAELQAGVVAEDGGSAVRACAKRECPRSCALLFANLAFEPVARHLSFSRAAETLHLSQPVYSYKSNIY